MRKGACTGRVSRHREHARYATLYRSGVMMFSRRVLDDRVQEIAADPMVMCDDEVHVCAPMPSCRRSGSSRTLGAGGPLDRLRGCDAQRRSYSPMARIDSLTLNSRSTYRMTAPRVPSVTRWKWLHQRSLYSLPDNEPAPQPSVLRDNVPETALPP